MPSSPEAATWQLRELRGSVPPAPSVATFAPAGPTITRPPVFEVSSTSGVPDDLLTEARLAAQAAGYAAGWASGIRAARVVADAEAHAARAETECVAVERRERLRQAFTALDDATRALEHRAVPAADELEELIITSALTIAEQLVGHSLRNDPDRAPAALARALSLAPAGEALTVRISAADYAVLSAGGADAPVAGTERAIELVADETLRPGDAVVSTGATVVDARVSAGLARVREVLAR
ncbi:MAG: flagellar assembly protein FliH [Pseudonocardiales bacterium]|nr:flagellar assembly protein FliH [Pseudonocardiales bacterium]